MQKFSSKIFLWVYTESSDRELQKYAIKCQKWIENKKVMVKTKLDVNFAKNEIRILILKYANFNQLQKIFIPKNFPKNELSNELSCAKIAWSNQILRPKYTYAELIDHPVC